jgi:protein MpaA
MKTFLFGRSSKNLPIFGYKFHSNKSENSKNVLVIGGVHGDEVEGVVLARGLMNKLMDSPIENLSVTVVPEFNIEGVLLKTRQNYTGVDLNRNLPTKDWSADFTKIRYYPGPEPSSEPENKNLHRFLESENVDFIISLHSWKPMLNVNGDCSPISDHISKETGLIIKEDIGYPTPGSLGTYAGLERGLPTLTYELQKGIDMEEVLGVHLNPLYEALELYSKTK